MPEKSARAAASLRTRSLRPADDPDRAGGAVDLDDIAVAKPLGDALNRDDSRNAQLAGHDRGVREQTAALDNHRKRGRERHDPSGIRVSGHQDGGFPQVDKTWVDDDPDGAGHAAGTAAEALTDVTGTVGRLVDPADLGPEANAAASLEPAGRRRLRCIAVELVTPQRHEAAQVGRRRTSLDEAEDLVHFEIEDVAGIVQETLRMEPASDLDEDAPDPREQPRPIEAQALAVAHGRARVQKDPVERRPGQRAPCERRVDRSGSRVTESPASRC